MWFSGTWWTKSFGQSTRNFLHLINFMISARTQLPLVAMWLIYRLKMFCCIFLEIANGLNRSTNLNACWLKWRDLGPKKGFFGGRHRREILFVVQISENLKTILRCHCSSQIITGDVLSNVKDRKNINDWLFKIRVEKFKDGVISALKCSLAAFFRIRHCAPTFA